MTRLQERLHTDLPIEATFDFVADFANAAAWDPGVAWSRRAEPVDQPLGVGTAFELGVRMGGRVKPMTYRVTRFERPTRIVLEGAGSGVEAVDDIRFDRSGGGGTAIDYTADIQLRGLGRLVQPFLRSTFARIGRDAAAGMAAALAGRARSADRSVGAR